ncbi:cuticle protein 10.9-like [Stegodyphus dumicola]|uniref:cuticle protein 10.9-like n=1 Tax=Stegodyphus dumicola TaxID=202533 RepID=UPI0015B252DA|nr:cuticle protein 10.9-like [Stegodyphus dumicola]
MFSKILLAAVAVLVVVEASVIPVHQPLHYPVHHAPQPYKFGYIIKDHHGEQHREEVGDGVSGVKGSYGFTDDRGIHRQVNYVADHAGFRAQVKTNEPGTANQNPAAVQVISSAPYAGHVAPVVAPIVVKSPVVVETPVYAAQAVPVVKGYGHGF